MLSLTGLSQFFDDLAGIGQTPCETVKLGHHQGVAGVDAARAT